MKKVTVSYCGWGESFDLGTLAEHNRQVLFEYSSAALARGLQLSPLHLPLKAGAQGEFPLHQAGLPGLFADSLPDGWGLLLMNKFFRKNGEDPATKTALDRLTFLGERAMGAFTFSPADEVELTAKEAGLLALARDTRKVIAGGNGEALRELVLLGGSPHGARPKVVVHYDAKAEHISTHPAEDHLPCLVKFPSADEHKEVCEIEHVYAQVARALKLEVPQTWYFDLGSKLSAFGIARFDVEGAYRVPTHTLAGVLNADFRLPSSVDYSSFLRVTRFLTRDEREVQKAFERAVFNVLFHNRDDHSKNLSYRLARDDKWRLAPCYDLTFSTGPGGQHHMDVCGEGAQISKATLLKLAAQGDLKPGFAKQTIERFSDQATLFQKLSADSALRRQTVKIIGAAIEKNRAALI